jgi:two-component system NtrC family sensor kinase
VLLLTVIQGPDKGRRFELPDHEPQLIGRSGEALPLSDTTISRRHAELTPDNGTWWVRDLGSQNGTFLNGVRLVERVKLRPGDQIRTGASLFVFGQTESRDPDVIRLLKPEQIDSSVERTLASNEDSVILSEPEPAAAAVDHLRVVYRLVTLTTRVTGRQELLRQVMEIVFAEFRPERGFIVAMGDTPDEPPTPVVVKYAAAPITPEDAKIHVSKTILQHVIKSGEGVLSSNAMTDPRFAAGDSVQRGHVRSAICSPIRFRERTYGAIYVDSSVANYSFTPEQLALMNAIGQHTALALANADLYSEKLQTERLAAIGETVASLSHSIKNILQGLRGGADVVELGLKKDDLKIAKGGWPILKRNLDRIVSLTLNMLAFSRQRPVEFELIKLGPIIDECAQLIEPLATTKKVALIVDVDPEMPPIALDPSLVHQSLMNLISNAVEAVEPEVGAVTVRATYRPAGMPKPGAAPKPRAPLPTARAKTQYVAAPSPSSPVVEIAVIDNGPGIPKPKQGWIFQPFNTTKGLRGTGLGLAVAKRIVEEHKGQLTVESDEGQGATFRIILPADAIATDPSATADPTAGAPPGLKRL